MSDRCDEALANLYLYLDSELDRVSSDRIRAHLADCPPCDGVFRFEHRLKIVVRERLREEVPPHVIAKIRAALETAHESET